MAFSSQWLPILEDKGLVAPSVPTAPALDILETPFQAMVIALAKANGWWVAHQLDSRGTEKGVPDLEFARERYFKVELKTEKGKLTAAQKLVINVLRSAGVCVYVFRPSDWMEIVKILR